MKLPQKYRTLIADDEEPARSRLKNLLGEYPHKVTIIGEAENGEQCKTMVSELKPDLLFLDIQMPGLNGFEVLQQTEHTPIVVFCTAYDEFALKAFETNSIDYIVKPVKAERIETTINKLEVLQQNSPQNNLKTAIEDIVRSIPQQEITTLPVKIGDRMLFLAVQNIAYFSAEEKYVSIKMADGKKYLCDYSLKELDEKMGSSFVRIQRSLLVNTVFIKEIDKHYNSRYIIKLNDAQHSRLTSGRNYCGTVQQLFDL